MFRDQRAGESSAFRRNREASLQRSNARALSSVELSAANGAERGSVGAAALLSGRGHLQPRSCPPPPPPTPPPSLGRAASRGSPQKAPGPVKGWLGIPKFGDSHPGTTAQPERGRRQVWLPKPGEEGGGWRDPGTLFFSATEHGRDSGWRRGSAGAEWLIASNICHGVGGGRGEDEEQKEREAGGGGARACARAQEPESWVGLEACAPGLRYGGELRSTENGARTPPHPQIQGLTVDICRSAKRFLFLGGTPREIQSRSPPPPPPPSRPLPPRLV